MKSYKYKYQKYKTKYLALKQHGGSSTKIVVFDFDNTLVRFNVNFNIGVQCMIKNCDDVINNFSKYPPDQILSDLFLDEKFIQLMRNAKAKGTIFAIASFGYNKAITKFILKHGWSDIFEDILTPSNFDMEDGHQYFDEMRGKNMMIESLMKKCSVTDPKNVMLLDDNIKNIKWANDAGYVTVMPPKTGLRVDHLANISRMLLD